ncbi:MAG TPA: NUDIX hydrolase [Caulobacteraceae bacterium]|jgi:8-oxo-dGTP pyrophosphatase MutT (NUDIX family)|nr:NUDIX hydrolase [Caulobacteraceae bacterium]
MRGDPGKRGQQMTKPGVQYAALPFRQAGAPEIMLVTSRDTRRWVIPKGWPMKSRKPYAAAAREALEEAGVTGKISRTALGVYPYLKRLGNGAALRVKVRVFALEVLQERASWPEMAQRDRRWFSIADAAEAVEEPELKAIILAFGQF